MSDTIEIKINLEEHSDRYKHLTDKEDFYSSPEYFKAYQNYRNNKGNSSEQLLEDLAIGAVKSGFDALRHTLGKSFDKAARTAIDSTVKDWAKNNPDTDWTD